MRTQKAFPVLACLICIILPPLSVTADQIKPSDRVNTFVNVRQEPGAGSLVVGTLSTERTADLIESIPCWYYIRLSGGVEGYVSKAWTVIVSEDPFDATNTGKTDLIIGSWNIKWFGYYSQDKLDYPRMAEHYSEIRCFGHSGPARSKI